MRDTFFSMPRFVNLCRKEMVESWRKHILRTVLMYGVLTIAFLWNGYFMYERSYAMEKDPTWEFVYMSSIFFCLAFGCVSASLIMERMKSKIGRVSVLMTPVTPFEYFFSRWMVYTLAYLAVFLIVFKMADYTRVLFYSAKIAEGIPVKAFNLSTLVGHGTPFESGKDLIFGVAFYFLFQSFFVLGSSLWPKNAFLKTFAAGAILTFVMLLGIYVAVQSSTGTNYHMGGGTGLTILTPILFAFALFNWTMAYFRFKESEIINRM